MLKRSVEGQVQAVPFEVLEKKFNVKSFKIGDTITTPTGIWAIVGYDDKTYKVERIVNNDC